MLFSDFIFLILEQDGTGHESFFQDYDGTGIFFFPFLILSWDWDRTRLFLWERDGRGVNIHTSVTF